MGSPPLFGQAPAYAPPSPFPPGAPTGRPQTAALQPPASLGQNDVMTLLMLQMMAKLQKDGGTSGEAPTGEGRAAARLLTQKNRVYSEPHSVMNEYVEDARRKLGAESGDAWQLWNLSSQIR